MSIPKADIERLRSLAYRIRELSEQKSNDVKISQWSRLTDLDKDVNPMTLVHLWPLAWAEALPSKGNIQCTHERGIMYERDMLERIWSVESLHDDTVIEPIIRYPHCVHIKPYATIGEEREYALGDSDHSGACKFITSINEYDDIDKISDPIINVDFDKRNFYRQEAEYIFGDILDVIPMSTYFAAKVVDEWVALRGMENLFIDMIDNKEWTHEAFRRITENFKKRFLTLEKLGVWGSMDKSDPIGSTGLRFNPEIPNYGEIMASKKTLLKDSWAFTCAEGFNCVSPNMHHEFGLEYDKELMKLFKYVNVGCCEVLSEKVDYVKAIPNSRRISISEWCDFERAGAEIGTEYVYGYKPSGVPFLGDGLHKDEVRRELRQVLEASKGCPTELILNIGGTLGGGDGAQKLVDWTIIANEEIDRIYG